MSGTTEAAPMSLNRLLDGLVAQPVSRDMPIAGIAVDSREVQSGYLFLAVPGARTDGRHYLAAAQAQGATAVAYEPDGFRPDDRFDNAIAVPDLRRHIGTIADRFYGSPTRQAQVIGVTGTNGKTTTAHLLAQSLNLAGRRCGLIGTLGSGFPDALDPLLHTTPDAISVHRLMRRFVTDGARTVCMEVSSHALDQSRVAGVAFDIAVFTNLTRDHLDYHGDMGAYARAKAQLFDFPHLASAIINADDRFGRELIERAGKRLRVIGYGLEQGEVLATSVDTTLSGLRLQVKTPAGEAELHSPLLGAFNASNLLAVLSVLLVCGLSLREAVAVLGKAQPVAGRMERFGGNQRPLVVVDYAHTPDALDKVLAALRAHTTGRLVCVFGCGGDRDRGKRPLMGAIAERQADVVILTNDNPRHEPPQAILDEIVSGMRSVPTIVPDRIQAIRAALRESRAGDIVLVAGKGHEDYQQIGDQRLPYNDRDTVQALLQEAA